MTPSRTIRFQDPGAACEVDLAISKLLAYCQRENWAGYDPFDALNSRVFGSLPFLNTRLCRLAFTQALKRSPIDLRRLAGIPKTQNPKALALFLAAFLRLPSEMLPDRDVLIEYMIGRIAHLGSQDDSYWCWGYSFPWQGRGILVPKGAPNLVCTTFVADALIDAFEQTGSQQAFEMALSAARYIFDRLYWKGENGSGLSYPSPSSRTQVHNANLLGAALFCRTYRHTRDENLLLAALTIARQSARMQRDDGSWFYGESPSQRWVDNFHTGYNLLAMQSIARSVNTSEFNENIRAGFEFYRTRFFLDDRVPRYFHDRTYPIDIHCVAQSILTLVAFQHIEPSSRALAESVFRWAMTHMWDQEGFFYYRVLRLCTIRTSYMRWSQAWMLLALATLRSSSGTSEHADLVGDSAVLLTS